MILAPQNPYWSPLAYKGMTQWIDIALDTWVWDQLQIHQRTKELKARNVLYSLFLCHHHNLRTPKDVWGPIKEPGYRKIAGLFQFQPSPLLTFGHHATYEVCSSETSLGNMKLSPVNVLTIIWTPQTFWLCVGMPEKGETRHLYLPLVVSTEHCDRLIADTNLWRVSPSTRLWEDLEWF